MLLYPSYNMWWGNKYYWGPFLDVIKVYRSCYTYRKLTNVSNDQHQSRLEYTSLCITHSVSDVYWVMIYITYHYSKVYLMVGYHAIDIPLLLQNYTWNSKLWSEKYCYVTVLILKVCDIKICWLPCQCMWYLSFMLRNNLYILSNAT